MMARGRKSGAKRPNLNRWWTLPTDEAARAVEDRIGTLWDADEGRRHEIEKNLRRFGLRLSGLHVDTNVRLRDDMRLNLTKSLTETIVAKVGKNRPRPLVLTDGGDYGMRQKAKRLQRFLDGAYQQAEVYDVAPLLFRNAMLCGTGALHFPTDHARQRFAVENTFPLELLVDHVDAARGEAHTRNLYRVYPADKDDLIDAYPRHASAIESADLFSPGGELPTPDALEGNAQHRTCTVYEAWRKAGVDADGNEVSGRHVLSVGGAALVDDEWCHDTFPFVFLHWSAPVRGFWGDSAVGEIRGLEKEVNTLLQRAQDAMRTGGMPIILAHKDSGLTTAKLSNEPGIVVNWDGGQQPVIATANAVHPQIIDQAWSLKRAATEALGTNELQVSATKPAGVESGRALEQLSEEHSVRFDTVSRAFESALSRGAAAQFVRVAKDLDSRLRERGKDGLRLKATYDHQVIDLRWDEVEVSPESLFIDVWPVSVLPHTPSLRTAEVERWQANKWIDDDQAKTLLDFPDLESVASVSRSDFELLEWQLAEMLDEGRECMPDRRQNLKRAQTFGTHAKLKAIREGVPASHLEHLENFLAVVDEWLLAAQAPAQELGPMSPGMGATAPLADPMMAQGMAQPGGMDPMMMMGGAPPIAPPLM